MTTACAVRATTTSTRARRAVRGVACGGGRDDRRPGWRYRFAGRPHRVAPIPPGELAHHRDRDGCGRRWELGSPATGGRGPPARRNQQLPYAVGTGGPGGGARSIV